MIPGGPILVSASLASRIFPLPPNSTNQRTIRSALQHYQPLPLSLIKRQYHPSKTTFHTIMFTKVISLTLLAVSAQGFAPIAPNSAATRPKTSLAFTVTIVKDGAENQTIECAPNTYILDAAELQGVQTPYSCRAGACSSCASLLIDGEIDQSGQLFLDDDKLDKGWLLSCVAYPKSDCTIKIDCEDEFYQS